MSGQPTQRPAGDSQPPHISTPGPRYALPADRVIRSRMGSGPTLCVVEIWPDRPDCILNVRIKYDDRSTASCKIDYTAEGGVPEDLDDCFNERLDRLIAKAHQYISQLSSRLRNTAPLAVHERVPVTSTIINSSSVCKVEFHIST